MSKNKVTQEQIAKLIAEAKIDVATVQEKCTVVTVTLKSGFILSESSACVDKANYNEEIGALLYGAHRKKTLGIGGLCAAKGTCGM